ncbi:MAG: 30S ribosomal protein S20 [Bacteroidia bacterium]|nr:30S ribosomal protein S20 [Bacteroidia bacterium]
MANHKSAIKRTRSNAAKRARNRYQHKTARTFIKRLKSTGKKSEAEAQLSNVVSMVDKLAKRSIIHKNKASNIKGKLAKFVAGLN